ncbi:hypothetical protein K458DRAFT_400461 [Lentithecium fluviatile CBS 122367]|uniref:Uncharacterized protein n=1 Tax=Lentithecium fluviatile CBS 122367 TaxID=1168545 RepID=A0A6G1JH33_9PLEO|nr:hypothetical protein K458DRAFT_400461 [Lentithecium fluviatile CBS 122367]
MPSPSTYYLSPRLNPDPDTMTPLSQSSQPWQHTALLAPRNPQPPDSASAMDGTPKIRPTDFMRTSEQMYREVATYWMKSFTFFVSKHHDLLLIRFWLQNKKTIRSPLSCVRTLRFTSIEVFRKVSDDEAISRACDPFLDLALTPFKKLLRIEPEIHEGAFKDIRFGSASYFHHKSAYTGPRVQLWKRFWKIWGPKDAK